MLKNYIEIPVSQLVHAPWNYKQTGERADKAKAKVRAAIRKRGQIVNLIVREIGLTADNETLYEVVNGNHRLDAFKEEGIESAVCCNLGRDVSQATAEMIALETNELNIEPDELKLAQLIKRVAETTPLDEMIQTLPYEAPEIENYIKSVDFSWQNFKDENPPEPQQGDDPAPKNRQMIVLNLPIELAEKFKNQLARFPTDADAIEHCAAHLSTIEV